MTHVNFQTPLSRLIGVLAGCGVYLFLVINFTLGLPRFIHTFEAGDLIGGDMETIRIEALDLTTEPGEIIDDAEKARFFERQSRIATILEASPRLLEPKDSELLGTTASLSDLPLAFWMQIIVGAGALVISGWIWAIRPGHRASLLFFLSGVATLIFTSSSAIYTTRDLALAAQHFRPLIRLNELGASAFGILMIQLFVNYPVRLKYSTLASGFTLAGFGAWTLFSVVNLLPAWAGVNLITLVEMIGICAAIAFQFVATKGQADLRASLIYLGLSVFLGAGFFIALNATPLVLGAEATVPQEYAFLSFLLIYLGLAAGISRYRLFDVGRWGFLLLFYGLGAALLVGLDGFLILSLGVDRTPAFALSLFLVGLLYLPLREGLRSRLATQVQAKPEVLTELILEVAFAINKKERLASWRRALDRIFQPLEIEVLKHGPSSIVLDRAGLSLDLPAIGDYQALRLRHCSSGRALFGPDSVKLAQTLLGLLKRAQSQREAYDQGAEEERHRMAQDLHDDIGSRLISLICTTDRETRSSLNSILSDLRTLVSEVTVVKAPLSEVLADIRFETAERAQASGLDLAWDLDASLASDQSLLRHETHKALRSGLRELISNTIRHAEASLVSVRIRKEASLLTVEVHDDGKGLGGLKIDTARGSGGFGLKSLAGRIVRAQGQLRTRSSESGFHVAIHLPLENLGDTPRTGGDRAPSFQGH